MYIRFGDNVTNEIKIANEKHDTEERNHAKMDAMIADIIMIVIITLGAVSFVAYVMPGEPIFLIVVALGCIWFMVQMLAIEYGNHNGGD